MVFGFLIVQITHPETGDCIARQSLTKSVNWNTKGRKNTKKLIRRIQLFGIRLFVRNKLTSMRKLVEISFHVLFLRKV